MRIKRTDAIAILVDVQEKLVPVMCNPAGLVEHTETFLKGLRIMGVPVLVSQQYTKGLGMTDSRLLKVLEAESYYDKISFSCYQDPEIRKAIEESGKKTVMVLGIESHICVQQTVLDLLENGYCTVVIADLVDSRKSFDREIALQRMKQSGAVLTTAEACLFELTERAGTDTFRAISGLVK